METRLLDRQWIERLLSESPAGVLKALGDSAYQDALAGVARPEDVEQGLEKALAETLQTIARVSPEPGLIDVFRLRWDFRNLKSLIKASVLKMADVAFGLAPGVGTVDIDVHLLGAAATGASCLKRDNKQIATTLQPGTYHFSLDTFVDTSGKELSGEYIFVVLKE